MSSPTSESELIHQARQTVKRIKYALSYNGSHSTNDFVNMLLLKWIRSGEYETLIELAPRRRKLDSSIRAIIIDRFRYHSRKKRVGQRVPLEYSHSAIPSDEELYSNIETHLLRRWLLREIDVLQRGAPTTKLSLKYPVQTGEVLGLIARGRTQQQVAKLLGISVGTVNNRYRRGLVYLGLRARSCQLEDSDEC